MTDYVKTDAELSKDYPTLEPEWTRGREKAAQVMAQFEAAHFKPILKTLSDAMTEHLWDLLRDFLLSDTESNLEGHMRHRIETTVQALLGAERWVVNKYVMDQYDGGKMIRKTLAALIPQELNDARIHDLETELATVRKELQQEREWNSRR